MSYRPEYQFYHEIVSSTIARQKKENEEFLQTLEDNKQTFEDLFDIQEDIELIFEPFADQAYCASSCLLTDDCWVLLSFSPLELLTFSPLELFSIKQFTKAIFEELDPLLASVGFVMDTKATNRHGYEFKFIWNTELGFRFHIYVDTRSVCEKVQIGMEPKYAYICKEPKLNSEIDF